MKFHLLEWWEYKTFICGGPSFHLELYKKQKDLHTSWPEKKINFHFLIVVSEMHLFYFSKKKKNHDVHANLGWWKLLRNLEAWYSHHQEISLWSYITFQSSLRNDPGRIDVGIIKNGRGIIEEKKLYIVILKNDKVD